MADHAATLKPLLATDSLRESLLQHEYSLLFFSASWCATCQSMTSVLVDVAGMINERVNIIKLDIDASVKYAEAYRIRSVPTLFLVKNDSIIAQRVGGLAKSQLTQWLNNALNVTKTVTSTLKKEQI